MHPAYDPIVKSITDTIRQIDDILDRHGADNTIYTNLTSIRTRISGIKRNLAIAATTKPPTS